MGKGIGKARGGSNRKGKGREGEKELLHLFVKRSGQGPGGGGKKGIGYNWSGLKGGRGRVRGKKGQGRGK
jgi:hypothetical protein